MANKRHLIIAAVMLVVILAGAFFAYGKLSQTPSQQAGTDSEEPQKVPAADFEGVNHKGDRVKFAEYLGKPAVVTFWASWCGPCKSQLDNLEELSGKLGDDVRLIGIDMCGFGNDNIEDARAYVDEKNFSYDFIYDVDGEAAVSYGVSSTPTTFFIDKEGMVTAAYIGPVPVDTSEDILNGMK